MKAAGKGKVAGMSEKAKISKKTIQSNKVKQEATSTDKKVSNIILWLHPLNSTLHALTQHGGPQAWSPCSCYKLTDWRPGTPCIARVYRKDITLFYLLEYVLKWAWAEDRELFPALCGKEMTL